MANLEAEVQDLLAGVAISQARHAPPGAIACMIADGTFKADNDTAEVWVGWDMIRYEDDGTTVIPPDKVPTKGPFPILNPPGEQTGLVGGERCWLFPVAGGAIIVLTSYDDAPGIDAGEKIHRQQSIPDNYLHHKNDGTSVHSARDRVIVTAPKVCLGENDSSGNGDGVMRQSDGQALADAIIAAVQAAFEAHCGGTSVFHVTSGNPITPPNVSSVSAQASTVSFSA